MGEKTWKPGTPVMVLDAYGVGHDGEGVLAHLSREPEHKGEWVVEINSTRIWASTERLVDVSEYFEERRSKEHGK